MSSMLRRSIRRFSSSPRIYNNILETVGNTPIIKINKLAPKNVDLYVKCEFFNPLSSVKDRSAVGMIEDAERRGELKPGQTVIDSTSGNNGISIAMVCAQKGYRCVITMAESFSIERRKIMRALGAKVILTPAKYGGFGMVKKAQELAAANNWYLPGQFINPSNPEYHANTTGPEILSAFIGKSLDFWVTGYGSGGTFVGAGRVLKAARPNIKIILSEPSNSALIASGLEQEYDNEGQPEQAHPAFKPHIFQGWAPAFIPKITQNGLDENIHDEIMSISGDEAMKTALDLAKYEGIFTGISGGATVGSALEVCLNAPDGSCILAMCPDTMERYLSTSLFQHIKDDMDEEEINISTMTPNYLLQKKYD